MAAGPASAQAPAPATPPPAAAETPPAPLPEAATTVPTLHVGGSVDGEIDASDPLRSGRYADDYRIALRAGQVIRIDMTSRAPAPEAAPEPAAAAGPSPSRPLDAYLEIYQAGESTPLAFNDNMQFRMTNARVVLIARADGDYVIRAAGARHQTGSYRLAVAELPNVAAPPIPMTGGAASFRLDAASAVSVQRFRGYRYADYTFEGRAGNRVSIRAAGDNPFLRLKLFDAADLPVGDQSGEAASGSAALLLVLPRSGIYRIRAQVSIDVGGTYRLELAQARQSAAGPPRALSVGAAVSDRLGLDSSVVLEEDSPNIDFFYKMYLLHVRAGETITIDMTSTDFDSLLEAGTMSVLGYAMAVDDDDSGGEFDARLVLHPVSEGDVYLRARSLDSRTGSFRLRVTSGEPAATAP